MSSCCDANGAAKKSTTGSLFVKYSRLLVQLMGITYAERGYGLGSCLGGQEKTLRGEGKRGGAGEERKSLLSGCGKPRKLGFGGAGSSWCSSKQDMVAFPATIDPDWQGVLVGVVVSGGGGWFGWLGWVGLVLGGFVFGLGGVGGSFPMVGDRR